MRKLGILTTIVSKNRRRSRKRGGIRDKVMTDQNQSNDRITAWFQCLTLRNIHRLQL